MKYFKILTLLLVLFIIPKSYAQNKNKLPIKGIDYQIGIKYSGKFIDKYSDALKLGLDKEVKNPKKFYKNNAVYLFEIGGGCFYANLDAISPTFKSNDLIFIDWTEPNEPCPEVGEAATTYGIIIISKKQYPNYKKLKFKYYWEK